MKNQMFNKFSHVLLAVFIALTVLSCKVTIEKPVKTVFTVDEEITFDAEYNGTGTIMWKSEFTPPNGVTQPPTGDATFRQGTTDIGKKYPWDFKKSNLAVGVHKITAYKNNDEAEITITILSVCDDPETDCSYLDNGCVRGVCSPTIDKCVAVDAQNGAGCDDELSCTENDQCVDGACLGQANCSGNGICTEAGCQYTGACEANADCEYLESECYLAYCNMNAGECVTRLRQEYCFIDGYCVAEGQRNPAESCQICNPETPNSWSPLSYVTCNDNNICTTGDHCMDGVCTEGDFLECDDGNICTYDSCYEETGCVNSANDNEGTVCSVDENIFCLVGTCQSGSCNLNIVADYCLIDGECITKDALSTDECGKCNPSVTNTRWYWDENTEGEICETGTETPSCGQSTCTHGRCLFKLDQNICFINEECVDDGQTTIDGCFECDVESGTYSGELVGYDSCDVHFSNEIIAESLDLNDPPIIFNRENSAYIKSLPAMANMNFFDKAFFVTKGGNPVMATCEVKDQIVSVAVRSYPGLREIYRKDVWTSTYITQIPDGSFCSIDTVDINGDGFEEIIVGAPANAEDIMGQIAVFEIDELRLTKISQDGFKLNFSEFMPDPGIFDWKDFVNLRTEKYNGSVYIVVWSTLGLQTYNIFFNEDGELESSASPTWQFDAGAVSFGDGSLKQSDIVDVSILKNNVVFVERQESTSIVSFIPFILETSYTTVIRTKILTDGDSVGADYIHEGFWPEAAETCGGIVYISELLESGNSIGYVFNPNTGSDIVEVGEIAYPINRLHCIKDVEWLRLPRLIQEEAENKIKGDRVFTDVLIKEPDQNDYIYLSDATSALDVSKINSALLKWGNDKEKHIGELELDIQSGIVEIAVPINVDHLIISGGGTVKISAEGQAFRNVTINGGSLVTDGVEVSISRNLVLGSSSADVSEASVSFDGPSKSIIAKLDGGDLELGSLKVDKNSNSKRVLVDSAVSKFSVNKIDGITGFFEVGDSTDFQIYDSSETVTGNGTLLIRSPEFTSPSLSFDTVNLYIYGKSEEEHTVVNVTGAINISGDFRLNHVDIPFSTTPAVFDLTNQVAPIIELSDVVIQGAQNTVGGVLMDITVNEDNNNSIVRLENVVVDNWATETDLLINTNVNNATIWSASNVVTVTGLDSLAIDVVIQNGGLRLNPFINSTPNTEMLGYPYVGFIDGTNCDVWPKEIEFDSSTVEDRLTATGAYFDSAANPKVMETVVKYLEKAKTKKALVIGSKHGLVLATAIVKFKLKNGNISAGYTSVQVAIDQATDIGYVISPEFLCTEDDLVGGHCDFLSHDNPAIGNAGNILGVEASGVAITNSTQILVLNTPISDSGRVSRTPDEFRDMDVNTVILAAPVISIKSNPMNLRLNTILLADTVEGFERNGEPSTRLGVYWVGNGKQNSLENSNEQIDHIMKVLQYDPETPAVGIIAANIVKGIKEFRVENTPVSSFMDDGAHADVKITSRASWESQGVQLTLTDNLEYWYKEFEIGTLSEDSWEDHYYSDENYVHNVNLEILDYLEPGRPPSEINNIVQLNLRLPSFHPEVEGGLGAIITDESYSFGKVYDSDVSANPKYKKNKIIFDVENHAEVLDALFYKMYNIVSSYQDSDPYDIEALRICFVADVFSDTYDGGYYCWNPITELEVNRYCKINLCFTNYSNEHPYCINEDCPDSPLSGSIPYNNLFCHGTHECYNRGDAGFDDSYWSTQELDLVSLKKAMIQQKDEIKTQLGFALVSWLIRSNHSGYNTQEDGPKEEVAVSDKVTRDMQFSLSNGELFNLYTQKGDSINKSHGYLNPGKVYWSKAHDLVSASPLYPDLKFLLKLRLYYYYKKNEYTYPNGSESSAVTGKMFDIMEENYNYEDGEWGVYNNSIGVPYGHIARSWNQVSSFEVENFDMEDPEPRDKTDDSYIDDYQFVAKPVTFSSYLERWYSFQDAINIVLYTLRNQREDAIFNEDMKNRLALLGDALQLYANQQKNASEGHVANLEILQAKLEKLAEEINNNANKFLENNGPILENIENDLQVLVDTCEYDNPAVIKWLNRGTTFTSITSGVSNAAGFVAKAIPGTQGVSEALSTFGTLTGHITSAIKAIKAVLWLFDLRDDPCSDVLRDIIQVDFQQYVLLLSYYEQLEGIMRLMITEIEYHMQLVDEIDKYQALNIMTTEQMLKDLGIYQNYVDNMDVDTSEYSRYTMIPMCQGLLSAAESIQKDMYATSQLLFTTTGHSYVPPYFTVPPAWNSETQEFDEFKKYGFNVSLWDSKANFRFYEPDIWGWDEFSSRDSMYDGDLIEEIQKVIDATENNDEYTVSEMLNEESMFSTKAELIEDRLGMMKNEIGTPNSAGAEIANMTFVVKTLTRIPCYYEYEGSTDNNCVKQPKYCDRLTEDITANICCDSQSSDECEGVQPPESCDYNGEDNVTCSDGGRELGGLGDIFLSKGAVEFDVGVRDLENTGFDNIIEDEGVEISNPTVQGVYFKLYAGDRWCIVDPVLGYHACCCDETDENVHMSQIADLYFNTLNYYCSSDEACYPSNSVITQGFDNDEDQGLYLVNAGSKGLKPLTASGELDCENVEQVEFPEELESLNEMDVCPDETNGDYNHVTRVARACTDTMRSYSEKQHAGIKSTIGDDKSDANAKLVTDNYLHDGFKDTINYDYINRDPIRGLPVFGTWYLVYNEYRANMFATALRKDNNASGITTPQNTVEYTEIDASLDQMLAEIAGHSVDTPYSKFSGSESMLDEITRIDVIFVVSKNPADKPYWSVCGRLH